MADRTYRLIVEGELSDELALAFPGMALTRAVRRRVPRDDRRVGVRIEDHGFIGDTQTGALVGCDGAVDWLCLPRYDT